MLNWMRPDPGIRVWFTADTHFQHDNILVYCRRPYATTGDMDADLIRRWNAVVSADDLVIHLGDFAMGLPDGWAAINAQLAGTKVLVLGNHDRSRRRMLEVGFHDVVRNTVVEVGGLRLWLNHYPAAQRPAALGPYDLALCGHVHDAWKVADGVVNVGVDVWDYAPISLAAVRDAA